MGRVIKFHQKGDFSRLDKFLQRGLEEFNLGELNKYGRKGVEALSAATPRDTGLASESWYYEIERQNGVITINWCNSDIEGGVNVAVILQYGHGTRTGGYVRGRDYINPAMRPIFDEIAESAWKEVSKG